MQPFQPYDGDAYRDYPFVERFCEAAAAARPHLVRVSSYGQSREGRPLLLLTLSLAAEPEAQPAFWLDGGTHASEWTGIMATLFAVSRWIEAVDRGDPEAVAFFREATVYVAPCLSPDGFQHLMEGGAFLRSTRRPPPPGAMRRGLEPQDVDGDGEVLFMRWRHPAGPWVDDPELPALPRRRCLEDDPAGAYFMAPEGLFIDWDGAEWRLAEARHALDLNRTFPVHWHPFSQFGMDSGELPLQEPESRGVAEALQARPNVCAAVTNHTYTGAILVAPYRAETPLSAWDKESLWQLASEAVAGTGYRAIRVYPGFIYEEGQTMPGVWADHLVTNRGIPAYTLEIWDPYGHAGVPVDDPARAFSRPEYDKIRAAVKVFQEDADAVRPWRRFAHPQLGEVEIGGLRQSVTFRNPPPRLLRQECEKAFTVADRMRRAIPRVRLSATARAEGDVTFIDALAENLGYLSTCALQHAARAGFSREPTVEITLSPGARLVDGSAARAVPHLGGWGDAPSTFRLNPMFPVLPMMSPRARVVFAVQGHGEATLTWRHPRSGVRVTRVAF